MAEGHTEDATQSATDGASDEEVVDALVALGVDEIEAADAVEEQRVPLVLVRQLLGGPRPYTVDEVAERGGIDGEVLRRVFRALGLPLQERYGEDDVQEAAVLAGLLETFPEDVLVRLARVRGMAVTRIAMSDLAAVRDGIIAPMRSSGADDLTVAVALAEAAKEMLPVSSDLLVHAHKRALMHQLSSEIVRAGAEEGARETDLTVGFVDLVGYTALSARVDPVGLDQILDAFEERVVDVAGAARDIDLVKFLGDAAMLVSPDPATLAETLLDVVERAEDLAEAPLRAGLAGGTTLVREGDYYGPAVNMAARLTDQARPWTVLADDELTDDLEDRFDLVRTGPLRVRGVGLRRPVRVMRASGE